MIETAEKPMVAEVCTAIVLWRPPEILEGEVLPRGEVSDRTGYRWFWEMVIDPGTRRTVASYLGPLMVAEILDRKRLERSLPLSLPRSYAEAYPIHKGRLLTLVKFKYPEQHRINDESVVRGLKSAVESLLEAEIKTIRNAKGKLLQPFPLLVRPYEEANEIGFKLLQEYAVIGEG